jgi:hypothetical protein
MYYYVMEEYRVSNELLTEDVYVSTNPKDLRGLNKAHKFQNLQATVQRVESYVRALEDKVADIPKKK